MISCYWVSQMGTKMVTNNTQKALKSSSRKKKQETQKRQTSPLRRNKKSRRIPRKKRKKNQKVSRHVNLWARITLTLEETGEKSESKDNDNKGWQDKAKGFFFEPNGGAPKPEGWAAALAAAAITYYVVNHKTPLKELIYMDFLNNYLLQNRVKEIKITKDRLSEVFNHRAEIEMVDGEKFYIVLGS